MQLQMMLEHDAAIQLDLAPSGQDVKHQIKQHNI